jgi:hypothetical protein
MRPETRYARSGDVDIYQVVGEAPRGDQHWRTRTP